MPPTLKIRLDFNKYDKYGQVIHPGNVCVRLIKEQYTRTIEFCVYKEDVRGSKSKGTYGRFITDKGVRSIKYSNVIFVFDKWSKRVADIPEITKMIQEYYEGTK